MTRSHDDGLADAALDAVRAVRDTRAAEHRAALARLRELAPRDSLVSAHLYAWRASGQPITTERLAELIEALSRSAAATMDALRRAREASAPAPLPVCALCGERIAAKGVRR